MTDKRQNSVKNKKKLLEKKNSQKISFGAQGVNIFIEFFEDWSKDFTGRTPTSAEVDASYTRLFDGGSVNGAGTVDEICT